MPENNPKNEVAKKQYEDALLHGKCRDPKTVKAVWNSINLFEEFTGYADFRALDADQAKGFKAWLEKKKSKNGEGLSIATMRSTLHDLRDFFQWLTVHPQYIRKVDGRAIQYLRLSDNANRAGRASREKPPPTLEELSKALAAMPSGTDIERRDRALFAFTVITCVRDDALVTLKMKDVDPKRKTVWQDPKHVRTKRRKGINTRFISQVMPEAEEIVLDWLHHAQDVLGFKSDDPLFPKTLVENDAETMAFEANGLSRDHWANAQPVREVFKAAFQRVGLPYYNPHLFRKTVVKWAQQNCSQLEFKAISQNLGHDHAMTTYNAYGELSVDEQFRVIEEIGAAHTDLIGVRTAALLAEFARRTKS
ncbi:site-specific integrase [Hwanghaeella grinnelliae]|uniref:Site-specific integrase n=1 Tax=Hwanghaeella grinnelliae TaxID=2500179 RepID=A0A437QQA0_9PROT|nr:tyrosine-type recombinase/integrase [Hwanghaeella grinnelliae]RVU36701.1 site-specific integrase [Hwanghaeella grinnelliae]